jgi:hypothetical protein
MMNYTDINYLIINNSNQYNEIYEPTIDTRIIDYFNYFKLKEENITDIICNKIINDLNYEIIDKQIYLDNDKYIRMYVTFNCNNDINDIINYLNIIDDILMINDWEYYDIKYQNGYYAIYYFCNEIVNMTLYNSGILIFKFNYE